MKKLVNILLFIICFSCNEQEVNTNSKINRPVLKPELVDIGMQTIQLSASDKKNNVSVIFENGLGDDLNIWSAIDLLNLSEKCRLISYNRGGYGLSTQGVTPRYIKQLASELKKLIGVVAPDDKIILVGHSLGGAIVRSLVIEYPSQAFGIILVDPTHEKDLILTQNQEDDIVRRNSGNPGARDESKQLIESMNYMETLGPLPDIPTVVITSLRRNNPDYWSFLHECLGKSISKENFTHVKTIRSGHHIQVDEPELVNEAIYELIQRL